LIQKVATSAGNIEKVIEAKRVTSSNPPRIAFFRARFSTT
jgi:hypothetical protein